MVKWGVMLGQHTSTSNHSLIQEGESKHAALPSNSGHTFLQHVIPPSLVNWPSAVSKKNTGMPQHTKKMT